MRRADLRTHAYAMNTDTESSSTTHRPLRRAAHDRMAGGVAAGIADYLGVDPTIVRIGFAGLTVMGGAGIPLYLASLLLVPEEGSDESIAASFLHR
jgi:phage shock protein PspC (stress-responsive transcriptional regulator)